MSAQIRPTRLEVSDRFPMLGFSIRADGPPQRAEVALASEPGLFGIEGKPRRTAANFYSTRASTPLKIAGGEAVYIVPPEVLAKFVGKEKLYFGLATSRDGDSGPMQVAVRPTDGSPYVSLKGLTGRSMQRVRVLPNRQQRAAGYNNGGQAAFEWAGDDATPGMEPASAGKRAAAVAPGNGAAKPAPANVPYDDGFGPMPAKVPAAQDSARPRAQGLGDADDPEARGIEGPAYTEVAPVPTAQARGLSAPTPDYPNAARFAPSPAFTAGRSGQSIDRIVIHITDAPTTSSTVNHFTAAGAQASSHYLVGQDGEIVQFVAEADTAWHARGVNSRSVGIEHVAIKRGGVDYPRANGTMQHFDAMAPSDTQYSESAALVTYLCDKYGLTPDRSTIVGHREADPRTSHASCPDGNWNWDHYMDLVTNRYCKAQAAAGTAQGLSMRAPNGGYQPMSRAMVVGLEDRQKARKYAADYRTLFQWSPSAALLGQLSARGFSVQTLDAAVGDLNLDFYKVEVTRFPPGWDAPKLLQQFIRNINGFIDTDICDFTPYDDSDARRLASDSPLGTAFYLDIKGKYGSVDPRGWDNAAIVISDANPQRYVVTTINTPRSGDHPVSGHRQFGYFVQDGTTTFYTRGADRATLGFPGTESAIFSGGEALWKSFQRILSGFINNLSGAATIIEPFSERFNAQAVREEFGRYDVAQSLSAARALALAAGSFTINWDEVESIAQPTDMSCWATAGAMVIGWRDRISLSPQSVAEIGHRSIKTGLDPAEVGDFAREMGLVFEYPASYSVDGFRTLLANNGPLFVAAAVPGLHAIVVTGLYSDGTTGDTYVRITDPWDRTVGSPGSPGGYLSTHATGSRYIMKWQDFVAEYERAATDFSIVNLQILHSGPQSGRVANTGGSTPPGYAMAYARAQDSDRDGKGAVTSTTLMPPPPPRARAMSDADAVVAIGGAPVVTVRGSQGNVSWELDQFHGPKHPGNVAPATSQGFSDAPTIRLEQWPVLRTEMAAVSAFFAIDWLYDGRSIGDVRISNIGVSNGDKALKVRGQVIDDVALYPPGDCAALKIRMTYSFGNGSGPEETAVTEVRVYGDGTHEVSSQWQQNRLPALPQSPYRGGPVQAMEGGRADAIAAIGIVVGAIQHNEGGVTWSLDAFNAVKHPNDVAPNPSPPFRDDSP